MRSLLSGIFGVCVVVAQIAGFLVHLWTCYIAYQISFLATLLTFTFPFISQIYWVYTVWSVTGQFFNIYTLAVLGVLGLYLVGAVGISILGDEEKSGAVPDLGSESDL